MNKIDEKATHVGSKARDSASGRRRFVRGVGIAIPVSLTVSARSALSGPLMTVSATAASFQISSQNATGALPQDSNGLSPMGWAQLSPLRSTDVKSKQQQPQQQIESYSGQTKKFGDVFSHSGNELKNLQMQFAVAYNNQLVNYLAAAYLNLVNNKVVGAYTLAQLQGMWAGRSSGFNPLPGSTVRWYEEDIKKYLASTWS